MAKSELVVFNGIKFRRYPESKHATHRNYFSPSANHRKRGVGALHQEIWRSVHGEIPQGHHIHHIDGNPLNNSIENLDCLPSGEHISQHFEDEGRLAQARKHIETIRPLAAAWHSSPEGVEWHRRQCELIQANRPKVERVCEQCKGSYQTKNQTGSRFCSNACKSKYRRANKLDHVDVVCAACEQMFRANKYDKQKCCSRKCAWQLRKRGKK